MEKLMGMLGSGPQNEAELAAALGNIMKELDSMAASDSQGYGQLIKDLGKGAGVDLPEEFVQRVAGPTPPELEPMPLAASVPLVRPANTISTSHPTLAILHFRAAPKDSSQPLPPPLQPPPPGSGAADVAKWRQACQFAMRQWREPAVQDTTAKPAANSAKLTPSAAASSSRANSSLLPALPSFPPTPPSLVTPGEHRVLVHFFLEVHPVTVKFAVEDKPPGSCWLLMAQAYRWLPQQTLPPSCKVWGPLKFEPNVEKIRCQVHPQWLPRDQMAAASAALQQKLKADALQGTSAAALSDDLQHQLLLDTSSTGDGSQAQTSAAGAASSSKTGGGGKVTKAAALPASTTSGAAGRLQAAGSSRAPASAPCPSSRSKAGSSKQLPAGGSRRPLIQVLGGNSDSDSDDSESGKGGASVPAAPGRSLVQEVVSAAAAAGSRESGGQEQGQEGGAGGLQLGGMLRPKGQRQEEGFMIKAVTSRKVQAAPAEQQQQQVAPASPVQGHHQQQQQQPNKSVPGQQSKAVTAQQQQQPCTQQHTQPSVQQRPAPLQEQPQVAAAPAQQAATSHKVGFARRDGTRLLRVVVTGVPAASAASLQVEALTEQQLLQLTWATPFSATTAAAAAAATKQGQLPQKQARDVGDVLGDPAFGIEALAALLDGNRYSNGAAAGALGVEGSADEVSHVRDQHKQQQQQLAVRLPPVAVGTWSAKFEAKHDRLVLEAAVV